MASIDRERIESLGDEFEGKTAQEILEWALKEYHPNISLASSFGPEDVALIDMISRICPGARVFTIETGYLFAETHDVIRIIKETYPINLEVYSSKLSTEEMEKIYGRELYNFDPELCCQIRKVQPLKKALLNLDAWITGLRRDQAPTRAYTKKVEVDKKFGLVKINPIADWTSQQVWSYIRANGVPYNILHDRDYPSIGCAPCTRPIRPGEDPRSGRWSGKGKTECGLHPADTIKK